MKWIVLVLLMASCSQNMTPEKTWEKETRKYQDRKHARQVEKKIGLTVIMFVISSGITSHFR